MQIMDFLAQMGGLQSMAKELGISEAQVASGASALAPAILGGMKKQAQSGGGLEGLGGMLSQLGGGGLASMIDMNGDGNALDDIMRMTGKVIR